jgi:hypothetical protein
MRRSKNHEKRFINLTTINILNQIRILNKETSIRKISLMYMDLDLEIPTYDTLNNLWSNITKGGIIVFDEYGYHKWSESKGVDRFIEEKNLEIKSLNFMCPTAYIKK